MKSILKEISQCSHCEKYLPLGPRPVIRAHQDSKIIIIGQAPGHVVHSTGIPWNDRSGDNLRKWMGISNEVFYDETKIALIPMGFCYPGSAERGDLPPRKECAPMWHKVLMEQMENVKMTLLIGQYSQKYYLKRERQKSLTETVRLFSEYLPDYFVLPHPSPRNNIWQKKNPWFATDVIPALQTMVAKVLCD